jgi:mannose-6-phosphate isomerase-like protein (cupin superfamily)
MDLGASGMQVVAHLVATSAPTISAPTTMRGTLHMIGGVRPQQLRRMSHMDKKINLSEKLATFSEYFSPRTVAQLNEYDVMVVKLKGEFVWHKHDETDDFFLVLKGKLDIQLRDRTVSLGPGEMFIVPKGVEHRPVAEEEVHLLLIEPTGTPNTGDAKTAAPRRLA